jgi:6-phospho-3-hexuloisomerase
VTAGGPVAVGDAALREVSAAVQAALTSGSVETLCDEVRRASRIACYGVGREGLAIKALCMRLVHLGLDAHVVGDMSVPPLGEGDLLIASAGPGSFSTVDALIGVAQEAGARTLVITAVPDGAAARRAKAVAVIPAQTMAAESRDHVLPMGSAFEISALIVYELAILRLADQLGQGPEEMRARHTNLE